MDNMFKAQSKCLLCVYVCTCVCVCEPKSAQIWGRCCCAFLPRGNPNNAVVILFQSTCVSACESLFFFHIRTACMPENLVGSLFPAYFLRSLQHVSDNQVCRCVFYTHSATSRPTHPPNFQLCSKRCLITSNYVPNLSSNFQTRY